MKSLLLLSLALAGCEAAAPNGAMPVAPDSTILVAYTRAGSCLGRPVPRLEALRFWLVPGWTFEGREAGETIGRDVYVAEGQAARVWVWEHELVHAFGISGHPDDPFRRCRLMPGQQ